MERWLDRNVQLNYLTSCGVGEMVVEAIQYRIRKGIWRAPEYVVMPNHVHLLIEILQQNLKKCLESFKEHTGREAAALLDRHGLRVWQTEWFDHWVRNQDEETAIANYIRQNPVKAGLVADYHQWPYGSWSSGSRPPDATGNERRRAAGAHSVIKFRI